jgi:hypothetical protein
MTQARVFTLTTRFAYDGDGARRTVEVVGHGTTTLRQAQGRLYTLDYGRGNRVLAEETVGGTLLYLYGHNCLGQFEEQTQRRWRSAATGRPKQDTAAF